MALTVYTTTWCGPCKRLKSQLTREGIAYSEVDVESDPEAAAFVMSVNNGNRVVPTVVADCHTMTNPSVAEVKRHLQGVC
ncbi:mycoredoxin [Microbispora sp. ATCC PTA-5024]|uniref:mycoredoxin n=1 Tax=Microbispora sp. ATCC PTA-5024 TaxID=316330 RepID=UPI0003DB8D2F|nr:mycoredoxin [Microbispora sp. ATCC PTA-5024]ETK31261.1 glutaredoxin [Microbispora sp. ATCC PTA-5024]